MEEKKSRATEEQQKILDSRAKRLVISASAGSGKTYILIEKLKDLICMQHVKVERLLVLTFTKVAAAEIKTRLNNAILSMKPTKELIESLDMLPLSDISTIDSFCEKIIKRNINKLEIDENFVILDEKNALKLKNIAFSNTYQHFSRNHYEKFENIYLAFKKDKNSLQDCIFAIQNFCSAIEDEEGKLEFFENHISEINRLAQERIKEFFKVCQNSARKVLIGAKSLELTNSEQLFLEQLENFISLPLDGNIFEVCQRLNSLSMPSLKGRHKEEVKAVLLAAREQLSPIVELAKKYLFLPSGALQQAEQGELVRDIFAFYHYYIESYQTLKAKKSGLDFADIEKFAKKLLLDDEVKRSLQERYDYIFIDEYQDTNRLQEGILKPIAECGFFTAVGDIKQGIYGFRNASMEIMQRDIKEFSDSEEGDALYLNGNFRTDEAILSFVNTIFEKIMTSQTVGIDYKENSMLKGMKNYLKGDLPPVCVDVVLDEKGLSKNLNTESDEVKDLAVYSVKDDKLENSNSHESELIAIINKIQNVLGSSIYDAKLEKYRKAEFGDIALLFRGRSKLMQELVLRLRQLGIAVNADLKESLIEDSQIALISSLLKLTLNVKDDISLASVMSSPFADFSIDELAKIRLENDVNKKFCDIILESSDEKVLAFKNMIEEFKFDIQIFGVTKALCRLFNRFDYYNFLNSFENSNEKIININNLFKLIKGANLDYNVAGIIALLENSSDVRGGEGGSNAITVTTIHATKGLEYPIVILCEAGENLKKAYTKNYILTEKFGLGCSLFDFESMTRVPSPAFLAGKLELLNREFIDEIMIFYVALTRAQNHLFIIGSAKEKDFSFNDVKNQNSYLKFIFYAFGENFATQLFNEGKIKTENFEFIIVEPSEIDDSSDNLIGFENIFINNKFENDIKNYLDFEYDGFDDCRKSYKNSVTGVLKQEESMFEISELENESYERVVNREEAILTGNAYHEALKILDFDLIECEDDLREMSSQLKDNLIEGYFERLDLSLLFKNILTLKKVVGGKKLFKEKEFIMLSTTEEINQILTENGLVEKNRLKITNKEENELIVQGIVDLFALGEDLILIDYKYTSCRDEKILIQRYEKQLKLYSKALFKAFDKYPTSSYLLSIKEGKLIEVE